MAIKRGYVSKLGKNFKLSNHIAIKEMQCKNGADLVLWSSNLVGLLEKMREYLGSTVTINSGFRTVTYNKQIGGAASSQHCKGTAADVVIKVDGKVVNAKFVCCLAQMLGFKGIGYISERATHLDMRESGSYRGDERYGYGGNVHNDFFSYFGIAKEFIKKMKNESIVLEMEEPSPSFVTYWSNAFKLGLTDGQDPKDDAKRGQVMTFIARKKSGNMKLKVAEGVQYCFDNHISSGSSPDLYSTRNQVAVMIYRAIKGVKEESFDKAWEWAKNEIGITDGSRQNDTATREEAIAMILRSGI